MSKYQIMKNLSVTNSSHGYDCKMQSFFDMGKGEYQIMTNLTKYEMETVVNYNAGEQTATVYTRDKSYYLCQKFCRHSTGIRKEDNKQDFQVR